MLQRDLARLRWGFELAGEPKFPDEFSLASIDALFQPGAADRIRAQVDRDRRPRRHDVRAVADALRSEGPLGARADDPTLSERERMRARLELSELQHVMRTFLVDSLDRRAWTPPTKEVRARLELGDDELLEAGDSACIRTTSCYLVGAERAAFEALRHTLSVAEFSHDNGDETRGIWVCLGHERPEAAGCGIVFRGRAKRFCPGCHHPLDYSMPAGAVGWRWAQPFNTESRKRTFIRACERCGRGLEGKANRRTCSGACRTAKSRSTLSSE